MSLDIEKEFKTVDWNDLKNNQSKFADDIFSAFQENGLLFIKNAPLLDIRDEMEEAAEYFFKNPDAIKQDLIVSGNDNEGYFVPKKGDYKEYFHLGRHTYYALNGFEGSKIPDFAKKQANGLKISHNYFAKKAIQYSEKGVEMGDEIFRALEKKLNLKEGNLFYKTRQGNHIARFLNYFPQDELTAKEQEGLIRAKAHTDICALTFLPPSKVKGLQVLKKQDLATAFSPKDELRSDEREWIDVPYMDDTIICNIGQSLSIKLNGILPPTAHRVRNPSAEDAVNSRIAMPIFYHFSEDIDLTPLPEAVKMSGGINLFENAKNIILKNYVEADSEFDPMRSICRPNEHPSIFLNKYAQKKTLA